MSSSLLVGQLLTSSSALLRIVTPAHLPFASFDRLSLLPSLFVLVIFSLTTARCNRIAIDLTLAEQLDLTQRLGPHFDN